MVGLLDHQHHSAAPANMAAPNAYPTQSQANLMTPDIGRAETKNVGGSR